MATNNEASLRPAPAARPAASGGFDSGKNPPKPPFALSVGVVGHKPDRLPKDAAKYGHVETEVLRVLKEIRREARFACDSYSEFFARESQSSLMLSLVTALAEGADTMAAKAAVASGYAIDAVLPFAKANYRQDFSSEAFDQFQRLYAPARSKLILAGKRRLPAVLGDPGASKAYEAAGLTVIGNCDILLAVWDGGESRGPGGTTEMLLAAAALGIPIIHIDANGINPPLLKWNGLDKFPVAAEKLDTLPAKPIDEALPYVIDELVRPPREAAERDGLHRHFTEQFKESNRALAFPLMMIALWVRRPRTTDLYPDNLHSLSRDFLKLLRPAIGDNSSPSCRVRAYAWADAVGLRFAQVFRSAFVVNFLVAALAVAAALASLLVSQLYSVAAEIALIFFVVINTSLGRYRGWHSRWVEPREVAERLRVAAMHWILGIRPRVFAGEEPAWTGWYARAIIRAQPPRSCHFRREQVDGARQATINILQDQCKYHLTTARRMTTLERRLEWIGLTLFVLTVLVALDHLLFREGLLHCALATLGFHLDHEVANRAAIFLSAVLPAFATATYGIRVIGDFEGIARRSERTHESLNGHIMALRQDPPSLDVLRRRARAAGEAMLGDVSSWRLAVESRGLAIPG